MGKTKTAFVGSEDSTKKESKRPKEKAEKVHIAGLKGGQRVKAIEVEPIVTEDVKEESKSKKVKTQKVRGKAYQQNRSLVADKKYAVPEALDLLRKIAYAKFDETVELHLVVRKDNLNISTTLPHSTGKTKKVEVANEETVKKLAAGIVDFDVLLATADMMPKLVAFARVLGPRGMMPNPKNGTLIKSEADAKKYSADSMTIKTEKSAPLVHLAVGKLSMKDKELSENVNAVLDTVGRKQILKAFLKSSMSHSIKLSV